MNPNDELEHYRATFLEEHYELSSKLINLATEVGEKRSVKLRLARWFKRLLGKS